MIPDTTSRKGCVWLRRSARSIIRYIVKRYLSSPSNSQAEAKIARIDGLRSGLLRPPQRIGGKNHHRADQPDNEHDESRVDLGACAAGLMIRFFPRIVGIVRHLRLDRLPQ